MADFNALNSPISYLSISQSQRIKVYTMSKFRKITTNPYVCTLFFITGFLIGVILPFCWGNDPSDKYGTISLLCEDRKGWFWLWTVLTGGCCYCNINRIMVKYDRDKKYIHIFVIIMLFGMVLTAATLKHSILTLNPKRVLHWIGAILYGFFALCSNFHIYLTLMRKDKLFIAPFAITCIVIIGMLIWLLLIGRSGYMEFVPIAIMEIMMYVIAVPAKVKQ